MRFDVIRSPHARDREVMWMLGGAGFFKAMSVASEVGVFRFLAARPGSGLGEIAEELRLPIASLRTLLMACCAMRLIERVEAGGYRNADWVTPAFAGSTATFAIVVEALDRLLYQPFFHLGESVRRGTNVGLEYFPGAGGTIYERLAHYPELETIFHAWMASLSAAGLPESLVRALEESRHVLDVGGGDATNAIFLARAHPELRVTVLDLPSVCERARTRVEAAGLGDRIDTHPCDIRTDPFPPGCDAILFSRIFNIYSEEQNRSFVERSARCLPDRGQLIVYPSMVCDDDETGPLSAAFLSLYYLCLATGEGRVYAPASY